MALTVAQIKAQGYTILTDPSQIKNFDIAGQSGVSGAKGSFLYGKPKAGASLGGTLPPEKPVAQALPNPALANPQLPSGDRQLPASGQGSMAAFQDVLKNISYSTLQQNKPSVADVINQYTDKGLSLVNPGAIENAYKQQSDLYARPIGDIYQSTMTAMQEVEKSKQEKFNTVAQDIFKSAPGFISSLTGEEFDQFKNLQFSPEMQVKLKTAQDSAKQEDNKFQFVPTTENQPGGAFDPKTGNFTPSSPTPGPTSDGGSISFRTNNPGNIKWTGAPWQTALGGVDSGIKATDGGSFAKFPTLEAGTNAQKQLLTGSGYANLTLDAAMKRWSNNGYGASVSPTLPANAKMSTLSPTQLSTLMEDMKKREGFTAPKQAGPSIEAQNWYLQIKQGKQKLSDIQGSSTKDTARLKNEVLALQAKDGNISNIDVQTNMKLQDKLITLDGLIEDLKGKVGAGTGVVGPTVMARFSGVSHLTGSEQNFVGSIKQIVSAETLKTLTDLKKAGGTLGALNVEELKMLQGAASKINGWEVRDENGNGKGQWAISEDDFTKELETLKKYTELAIKNAGGTTGIINTLEQNLASNPEKVEEYNALVADNPGLSEDDINQLLGFNQP